MTEEMPELPRLEGLFALPDLPRYGSVAEQTIETGWWELDQIFRFYPGQFVLVTGVSSSGKSTFMMNLICKLAREKGIASSLYVPENERYLHEKLRLIWNNDETFEQQLGPLVYVQSAEPEYYNSDPKTLDWVLDRAYLAVKYKKVEIVMIDPWNELDRARGRDEMMTDYIAKCLMYLKQFARHTGTSVVVVAHPTKAVNENGGRVPRLYDVEGSANWFNKCDNGLVVHRESNTTTTKVISQKVREIGAGSLGTCYFTVDPATGIYTPQVGAVGPVSESIDGFVRV